MGNEEVVVLAEADVGKEAFVAYERECDDDDDDGSSDECSDCIPCIG